MLHPILLTGVALVGLPILLHLIMRQEPKRLPFPAFRFLKLRRRINQRKIRLRHLLLLALRMLVILATALALFQPELLSERLSIRSEQPVAAVLVIDTSPSMGYVLSDRSGLTEARQRGLKLLEEPAQGPWTALDEARFRALELLGELPPNSRVAVLDTADREAGWALSAADARKRIQLMKKTRAGNAPVTRAVQAAYQLFARGDQELKPGQQPLPRLLCVFSDRTLSSWDSARVPDLVSLRERVKEPAISGVYLDVGVEKPVNMAITGAEVRPQVVPGHLPAVISVTVQATGQGGENAVVCRFDGETEAERKPVKVAPNEPATVEFRRAGLKPGLHQAEITLVTDDSLPFDNRRYVTFRVREPRLLLAVADEPPAGFALLGGGLAERGAVCRRAGLWRLALQATRMYVCEIRSTAEVRDWKPADWGRYETVTLAGLAEPGKVGDGNLWAQLDAYVEAGGQLVVLPGGAEMVPAEYQTDAARKLMPGNFRSIVEVDRNSDGVTWAWDALNSQHPMLAVFQRWKRESPDADIFRQPPMAWQYWDVEPIAKEAVVVPYADAAEADQRHPALLERRVGQRGRVMLFTTTFDGRRDADGRPWNDYLQKPSAFLVFANETTKYLTGETEEPNFNFTNGQNVLVKWPLDAAAHSKTYYLSGPDVVGTDAILNREEGQAYLRLGPERMGAAGNFTVTSEDRKWLEGFSLNPPPEESSLDRVAPEAIEELFGPGSVITADKELTLADALRGHFGQPMELFPFLMILLLLLLAFENLLANKFYKQPEREET